MPYSGDDEDVEAAEPPMRCRSGSSSESEKRHRQHHTRSTKEKRGKPRKYTAPTSRARVIAMLLGLVATLGALCALGFILPRSRASTGDLESGSPMVSGSRVVHLTLAGSERKARYGLSASLTWDEFLQGVQDRLHLAAAPAKIETSSGWAIRSVSDLMHRDNVVVHSVPPPQEQPL